MGIEPADCLKVGELLGKKVVANEIVAFKQLADWLQPDSTDSYQRAFARDRDLRAVRIFEPGDDRHPDRRHRSDGARARARTGPLRAGAMLGGTAGKLYDGLYRGGARSSRRLCLLGLLQPKAIWQQAGQANFTRLRSALGIDEQDQQIVAELGQYLPASAARRQAARP